jgi:hypothetical protein
VQTLDISTVLEEGGDLLPISGSVGINQFLETLVFLLGPPALLHLNRLVERATIANLFNGIFYIFYEVALLLNSRALVLREE